ncbi:MAG TPA: hypothetical protein VNO33_04480 [Kofleriaceae bacterium]|nr:hypothetical protein [Kofleriaceae bacterium]
MIELEREPLAGGLAHYQALVRVGDSPNARLRLHRVVRERKPWVPARTEAAAMLLHGDFATFTSNFAPIAAGDSAPPGGGLAIELAARGIDVWGLDRRWTTAPAGPDADLSDYPAMGLAAESADIGLALALARTTRGLTGAGWDRFALAGFSRGGLLAYVYTAGEARRPASLRHVRALAPIDVYAAIAPEDEALRLGACTRRDEARNLLAAGIVEQDNSFFIDVGGLAAAAPDDPSPIFQGITNREAMLATVGQTYFVFPATPLYHLIAPVLDGDMPVAAAFSSEAVVADWLIAAPQHQSLAEIADGEGLWCGDEPLPGGARLADIRVPLFYLGAAGGFGDHGLYTTSLVGSDDVTAHVVQLLEQERVAEDFGHADLLFGDAARELAWTPLADWILGE